MSFRCSTASVVVLALTSLHVSLARADKAPPSHSLQECALAYESSQEHRRAGVVSVALSEFARCSQDDCPAFMRSDCSQWSKEIVPEQPSVLFAAKRGGTNLNDVRVSIGDRVLAERLPSPAIELDVGSYDIRFEAPGSPAVVQNTIVRVGEKNRIVQVDFSSGAELTPALHEPESRSSAVPAPASDLSPPSEAPRVLPWALLAFGSASIGVGMGFAAWGHGDENHLANTCSPNCTDAQVRPVQTKYLIGDASFGVGLLSVSVAAYLFLSRGPATKSANSGLPVSIEAGPNRALATYGARF